MTITNGQRDTLRTHPHLIRLYLSVLVPSQVYCGTVNGDQARGEMDIPLNNVSGNINNVLEGMTVVIGTSCGDDSVSKRRVRDNSQVGGGIITIDENSLDLAGGEFFTVLRNFELWPRYPRILTTTPWTFYKDYDITYVDQNEDINPVAIAGPHQAGFLDGATVTFTLDSSDSYALASGAAITGRTWSATGGSIADANAATTTITFNTAGTYWITLVVTDGTKTHTTRRVIFVHDRTGSNAPYTEFEFETPPNGDWEQGGWNTGLVVRGDATASDFPDGALVLAWYESWYSGTQTEIADESVGANILFAGYIRRDSVVQDWDTGSVSFEATTIDDLMRNHMMFSISLQAPTGQDNQVLPRSPERWYEFDRNNLTVATAIHHLWYWHSTLLDITDVFLPTSNTLLIYAVDDFAEGDLYNQADTFARQHGIFAHVACNKKGQVYVEEDINLLDAAGRGAVNLVWNGGIQDSDRRDEIEILRQPEMQTSFVHFSGFSFDGATYTAIICKAPGDAPEAIGAGIKNVERQVLDDQAQANEIAGRVLGVENDPYREFRIKFAGNYSLFDIVPQQWLELTIAASDTPRGITLTNTKLICRTIATEIDAANGTLLVDCVFVREASAEDGIAGDYPTDPPDPDEPGDPDWPPDVAGSTGALVAFDEAEGCWYRGPGAVDWVERDAGLPAGAVDNDNQGGWDPWWFTPEKQGTSDPSFAILFRCQDAHIYKSIDCGVTWEEITPADNPPNFYSDSPAPTIADVEFIQRADNIHINGEHYFLVRWTTGGGLYRGWLLKTDDDGESWTWQSLGRTAAAYSYVMTEDLGLYESDDFTYTAGHPTWTLRGQRPFNAVNMFAIDLSDPTGFRACANNSRNIYVQRPAYYGDYDWHLVFSKATGDALVAPEALSDSGTRGVFINSEKSGHMYTIGRINRVFPIADTLYFFYSQDYGLTWNVATVANRSISQANYGEMGIGRTGGGYAAGEVLYLVWGDVSSGQPRVYYSVNEGLNWGQKDQVAGATTWVPKIMVDPTDQATSYVDWDIGANAGIAKSTVVNGAYSKIETGPRCGGRVLPGGWYIRTAHAATLDRSNDAGAVWSGIAADRSPTAMWTEDGDPNETCIGQGTSGVVVPGDPHIISATANDGVTWNVKAGANANTAGTGGGDSIPRDCGGTVDHGVYTEDAEDFLPIWMDVDTEDGSRIWLTVWVNGTFYLEQRNTSDLAVVTWFVIGHSTKANVQNSSYIVFPHTPLGDKDYVIVFGRTYNVIDLLGLRHVFRTTDGGATWTSVISDWGDNACSALLAGADDGGGNRIYTAVRDADLANPARLYRGTNDLSYVSNLPFGVNRGVLQDALTIANDGSVAAGAYSAGAIMVVFTIDPFTTWTDITDSYPVTGAVRSLTYL